MQKSVIIDRDQADNMQRLCK